jgi:hypothetical protein
MAFRKDNPTTVKITINEDGGFEYSISTHRMNRKGKGAAKFRKIKWSADGPFAIDFGDRSPFKVLSVKNNPKSSPKDCFESEEVEIERTAPIGRYRYAVAVCTRNEVFIDACPEVVVEC